MSRCPNSASVLVAVLIFFTAAYSADPPTAKSPTVEVVGLEIKRALSDEKEELQGIGFPGTAVDVFVALPGKHIICYDSDQSKLDKIADDLGTDLTKAQPGRRTGGAMIQPSVEQVSRDGKKCRLTLRAAAVPAKGAKSVSIKGSLVLKCGSDERTIQTGEVDLPGRDAKVTLGKYVISGGVVSVGDNVMLNFESESANVKSITFFGPDYKEVKEPFGGFARRPGAFSDGKYQQFIHVPKPKGKITIRVAYFNKVDDVVVPLDVTVGLGL